MSRRARRGLVTVPVDTVLPGAHAARMNPYEGCFACGRENPDGLHLEFELDREAGRVRCIARVPDRYRGAPRIVHGGMAALLLDEAMSHVNRMFDELSPTATLSLEFSRPVPIDRDLVLEAVRVERDGRKITNAATIRDADGTLLARGTGVFVVVGEEWFEWEKASL